MTSDISRRSGVLDGDCPADCTLYWEQYASFDWWSASVVATVTLATVVTVIGQGEDGMNTTTVTTVYNTETNTDWPTPTNTNADGTQTVVTSTWNGYKRAYDQLTLYEQHNPLS